MAVDATRYESKLVSNGGSYPQHAVELATNLTKSINTCARILPYLVFKYSSESSLLREFALAAKVLDGLSAFPKGVEKLGSFYFKNTSADEMSKFSDRSATIRTITLIKGVGGIAKTIQGVCKMSPRVAEKVKKRPLSIIKNACDFTAACSDLGESIWAALHVTGLYLSGDKDPTDAQGDERQKSISNSEIIYRLGAAIFSASAIVLSGFALVGDLLGDKAPKLLGKVSTYGYPMLMVGGFLNDIVAHRLDTKALGAYNTAGIYD